jgi:hypothetical protein
VHGILAAAARAVLTATRDQRHDSRATREPPFDCSAGERGLTLQLQADQAQAQSARFDLWRAMDAYRKGVVMRTIRSSYHLNRIYNLTQPH